MTTYTTAGSSGGCGHEHHTEAAAVLCLRSDRDPSKRRIIAMEDGLPRELNAIESEDLEKMETMLPAHDGDSDSRIDWPE